MTPVPPRSTRTDALFPDTTPFRSLTSLLVEAPPIIPDVHPGIAEIYKRKVAPLTATLGDPGTRLDASSDIRSLVGKIILHPGDQRGEVHATLHGSLMGILDFVNEIGRAHA